MADEEDIDLDDDDEGEGKQGGKKIAVIIVAVLLLIGGGAAGAYFMGMLDGLLGKEEATEEVAEDDGEHDAAEGEESGHGDKEAVVTYYDLPDFLVNLSSNTSQTSFLKMKVTLKLPSEKDLEVAQQKLPELQDHFNTYLRDLRATDLGGSAGMYRLREELLARANKTMAPGKVDDILFREILIQ